MRTAGGRDACSLFPSKLKRTQVNNDGVTFAWYARGVAPELAGFAEVVEILGVPKRTAARYVDRDDFPEPIERLRATPVWRRVDVEEWGKEHLPLPTGRPKRIWRVLRERAFDRAVEGSDTVGGIAFRLEHVDTAAERDFSILFAAGPSGRVSPSQRLIVDEVLERHLREPDPPRRVTLDRSGNESASS